MKLSNDQIVNAASALETLASIKLPIRVSYRVAELILAVQRAAAPFEVAKQKIIDQHAVTDADTPEGKVTIGPEGAAQYAELLTIEAELDAEPIPLADLGDVEIEPQVLLRLGPLVSGE